MVKHLRPLCKESCATPLPAHRPTGAQKARPGTRRQRSPSSRGKRRVREAPGPRALLTRKHPGRRERHGVLLDLLGGGNAGAQGAEGAQARAEREEQVPQAEEGACRRQSARGAFFWLVVRAERPRGSRARCAGARAPRLCARAALGVVRVHLAYGVVPRGATLVRSVERASVGAVGAAGVSLAPERARVRGTARRRVVAAALRGM